MNRFLLITVSFLIFIIGIGCVAATDVDSEIDDNPYHNGALMHQPESEIDDSVNAADDDAELLKWYGPDRRVFVTNDEPQNLSQQQPTPYDPLALEQQQPTPYDPLAVGQQHPIPFDPEVFAKNVPLDHMSGLRYDPNIF